MRVFAYEILTQLIIILGRLRKFVIGNRFQYELRKDRTFYTPIPVDCECCDCGLRHAYRLPDEDKKYRQISHKSIPIRPQGYTYKLRYLRTQPSKFYDESVKK